VSTQIRETGQTILSGNGRNCTWEIIVDRMMREFGVGAKCRQNRRWRTAKTIRKNAEAEGPARQTDRRPRPVRTTSRFAWNRCLRAPVFEFVNDVTGGRIPQGKYINPTEMGIKEALEGGILAGLPDVGC